MPTLPKPVRQPKAAKLVKIEVPEDSIGLRIVACGIAVLCIVTACLYVNSSSLLIFFYLWGALTGSYVSYQFRHQKTFWLTFITSAGLLIVLGNFIEEMVFQFSSGKIQALVPFIHVLTGLQALHTFDLRAKSDINVSALIGLGLFACTAVIARDALFAYITLGYISLIASLLYYEAVSRTQSAGAVGTSSEREENNVLRETAVKQRVSAGSAFVPLALLPVVSIFVFLALPRVESLFDLILSNVRRAQNGENLNLTWVKSANGIGVLGTMPGLSGLPKSMGGSGGTDGTGSAPGTKPGGTSGRGTSSNPSGTILTADGQTGPNGESITIPGPGGVGQEDKGSKGGKPSDPKTKNPDKIAKPPEQKSGEEEDKSMVFRNKETAEHDEELIMRVMSSRDTYYRRLCFDKYDGHQWTISSPGKVSKCSKRKAAYQELAGVPSLFVEPGMHSSQLTQEVTIEANIGHLIPVASIPQQMSYPDDPILVDQFGALRTTKPIKAGTHYRVVSQVPDYDLDEMRKAAFDPKHEANVAKEFENYLQLPADVPPQVASLAKSIAGTDGNWFTKAERICNYLRRNFKYSSDLSDPDNKEEISSHFLLRSKEGACGPFSTSFVVMCRAIGIPARCIGGFGPGDFNTGTGMHEIKNKHGHAWGEVYIPGYDWVPFDATPTGLLPKPTPEDNSFMGTIKKGMEQLQDKFANQTPAPPPLPPISSHEKSTQPAANPKGDGGTLVTKPGATTNPNKDGKATTDNSGGSGAGEKAKGPLKAEAPKAPEKPIDWHEVILLVIVIPAIMLLFQAIRAAVQQARQAKKKRSMEKPKPSTLLYLKVVDDLARVKIHRLPTDTSQDLMARFSDDETYEPGVTFHPELEPLCKRFMELYIADRFGCDDATELRAGQLKKMSEQIHTLVRTRHHDN
jgi:hypothetical protein